MGDNLHLHFILIIIKYNYYKLAIRFMRVLLCKTQVFDSKPIFLSLTILAHLINATQSSCFIHLLVYSGVSLTFQTDFFFLNFFWMLTSHFCFLSSFYVA